MLEAETAGTKEQLERAIARAAAAEEEVAQMRAALADLHVQPQHAAQCIAPTIVKLPIIERQYTAATLIMQPGPCCA